MKKMLTLTLSLMMALSLVACSTTDAEPEETTVCTEYTEVTIDDDPVYVAVGTEELDLGTLVLPLDDYDYVSIEIDEESSDYDLTMAGEYTLVVILTNEDGEMTKVTMTLVVDEEETIAEKLAAKLAEKSEATLVIIGEMADDAEEEAEEEATVNASSNSSSTSGNSSSSSSSNSSSSSSGSSSSNSNSSSSSGSSSSSSSSSSTSGGTASNGLSTNPSDYGLDPDNIWVQAAMKYVGQSGLCQYIKGLVSSEVGKQLSDWGTDYYEYTVTDLTQATLKIGDRVIYKNMVSGSNVIESHIAIYLGNGLAIHGNWTGGIARIASVYQTAEYYFIEGDSRCIDD